MSIGAEAVKTVDEANDREEVQHDDEKVATIHDTIAEKRNQQIENEMALGGDKKPANDAEVEEEPTLAPEPETVTVVINGEKKQVDKAKVDKAGGIDIYQKRRATEEGLQNLSNQRKILEQERLNFEQKQQDFADAQEQHRLSVQDGIKENTNNDLSDDGQAELFDNYHQALINGDDSEAKELFFKLNPKAQSEQSATSKINEDEIIDKAADIAGQRLAEKARDKEIADSNVDFRVNHPDIASDKHLYQMARNETVTVQMEHPDWSPSRVIEEAATRTETWYEQQVGKVKDTETTANKNVKIQNKRKVSAGKSVGGKSTPPPPPKQETNSEYVTRLRKQRGLE